MTATRGRRPDIGKGVSVDPGRLPGVADPEMEEAMERGVRRRLRLVSCKYEPPFPWARLKRHLVAWAVWTGIVAAAGAVCWELMR